MNGGNCASVNKIYMNYSQLRIFSGELQPATQLGFWSDTELSGLLSKIFRSLPRSILLLVVFHAIFIVILLQLYSSRVLQPRRLYQKGCRPYII